MGLLFVDTYKEQYERVFKKMKFLEAELAAFGKIKRELAEKSNRWKETLSLMNLKSKQMREFYDRVKEKDEDITKRAEKENEVGRLTNVGVLREVELLCDRFKCFFRHSFTANCLKTTSESSVSSVYHVCMVAFASSS